MSQKNPLIDPWVAVFGMISLLAVCGCDVGFGEFDEEETTVSGVLSTSPGDGAAGVSRSVTIRITFDRPTDQDSLEHTITPGVAAAASWSSDGKTVTLVPSGDLAENTRYTVRITSVSFLDGTELEGSFAFSFTTAGPVVDMSGKWSLWTGGTVLRGANIYQRLVYPAIDGSEFLGPGPLGPPYRQDDIDRLAALGANYVNISHAGLFTEKPPYQVSEAAQANLDRLLGMIAQADMFAVISFRTGPGRTEFSIFPEEAGSWYPTSYQNYAVWTDQAAQDAWVEMWRYTAQRYRDNPIVVGYDLMVEPNSNEILYNTFEPDEFYPAHAGSLADWNPLAARISAGIREVDGNTPILIGGLGYSAVAWLPYLQTTGDPHTVYMVHQYEPFQYTHQDLPLVHTYPGVFDADWDGVNDQFNRAWLDDLLSTVDAYKSAHDVPVSVNEFGVVRWEPGAAEFMDDEMALFEQRGMNHALWNWDPPWEPLTEEENAFNFRFGPDPNNHRDVASSGLIEVIKKHWSRNTVRPSNVDF